MPRSQPRLAPAEPRRLTIVSHRLSRTSTTTSCVAPSMFNETRRRVSGSVWGAAAAGALAGAGAGLGATPGAAGTGGTATAGPPGASWTAAGGATAVGRAASRAAKAPPATTPTATAPAPLPTRKSRRVTSGRSRSGSPASPSASRLPSEADPGCTGPSFSAIGNPLSGCRWSIRLSHAALCGCRRAGRPHSSEPSLVPWQTVVQKFRPARAAAAPARRQRQRAAANAARYLAGSFRLRWTTSLSTGTATVVAA